MTPGAKHLHPGADTYDTEVDTGAHFCVCENMSFSGVSVVRDKNIASHLRETEKGVPSSQGIDAAGSLCRVYNQNNKM